MRIIPLLPIFLGMKDLMLRLNVFKIEFLRQKKKYTQEQLATRGDLAVKTVGNITRAAKSGDEEMINTLDPRLTTISGLSKALGVPALSLLEEVPDEVVEPSSFQ